MKVEVSYMESKDNVVTYKGHMSLLDGPFADFVCIQAEEKYHIIRWDLINCITMSESLPEVYIMDESMFNMSKEMTHQRMRDQHMQQTRGIGGGYQ